MEATLTCAVCLSLFEEPVTLPRCSHNFCRTCVVACLGRGRRGVVEPSAPPPSHERPPRAPEAEPGAAPGSSGSVSVPCPLCRKVCALPGQHGVAALPVNTTLAEVVKLFKASRGGEARGAAWASAPVSAPGLGERHALCEKHPGEPLQFFCRVCCRPACGPCASEEHQGGFHSVDLVGAVYQEQKLNFFSYLKEIRKIHEQLVKQVAAFQSSMETQKQKEEEMIKRQFEYICKTMEMKKQQLLDSLESQKEKREKEYEIWKKMKDAYKKTIEKYLNESEKIVNECDPQRFLEVACNLNNRMKNQIYMIQISSQDENLPGYKQMHMDTTSVVHSIFALQLTPVNLSAFKADILSRDRECVVFGNTDKKSEVQKKIQNVFKPVAGIDVLPDGRIISTQIMSIAEVPEFGEMSHEEVRYNYYMAQVDSDDLEKQAYTSSLNGRCIFPDSPCSSNQPPEAPHFSFTAKPSNLKLKPQVLQRQDVNETSFSKSLGYLFSTPAVNLNFSGSNNSFNLFNVKGSHKDNPKTSLSENTECLLTTTQIPEANAAALSCGTSLAVSPDLLQVAEPSSAVLNLQSSHAVAEHTASTVFSSSSGKASVASLKNRNSIFSTVLLDKPENQNSNVNNLNGYTCPASNVVSFSTTTSPVSDSADNGKTFFSAFPTTTESGLSQPNYQQSSFSLCSSVQNRNEEAQIDCQRKENNLGNSGKKLTVNCTLIDSLPYKSSCCVRGEADVSEKQSAPGKVSANYFWETNTTPMFSFPGSLKNNPGPQTACITFSNKTRSPSDKSKMESNDHTHSAVKNSSPSKDLKNLMHSSSFFFMEKLKSETESTAPPENVAHDSAANKTRVSGDLTELNSQSENPPSN